MKQRLPAEAIEVSAEAVQELSDALAGAGIVLPSLAVDLVSCTSVFHIRPLVELGRCDVDTARRLAAVVRAGQARA
ncbi:hypothetical protein [Streptomyces hainanensis]|uniref:Uncharacterized protein n=1 Tax=Streptomyces hainanensis TaxID=402648 RepID=A0A4R4TNJ1_9ACTN|nr:hypothetical protein [Streptomyces hainanensis]TDC77454.1 hypothetical protein E1283_07270 [Streptomyces hainanensis]